MTVSRFSKPLVAIGVALALTLAATPALPQAPAPTEPPQPAVVPFRMLPSNHMVVEAKINDQGPFRLIFDLGSPVTLLASGVAERTGCIPKNAPRAFLFGTRGEGKIKTMELGALKAEDIPVVVMDHPALKALGGFLGKPIEGIMGYTFFARYRTTIDYRASEMTFVPVEFQVRNLVKDLEKQLMGPKVARRFVLTPKGLWGLNVGGPEGGVSAPGVPVTAVRPGSPAEAAGILVGDIITSLDGRWTASVADAYAAAAGVAPGEPAQVVILRDGMEQTISVTPKDGF
jgi:membrane-associated protease RseP (regulator of RpoE activity)